VSAIAARVLPAIPSTEVRVLGDGFFPVRRVYCVGRNYLEHICEMKEADEREPPFFFQKPRDTIVLDGVLVPHPPFTSDFQFDVECSRRQVTFGAGDLIYTGTPAGVGPVVSGDLLAAHIEGLPSLTITITPREA
jgi:2-keto-4-pentenoate hydratase/2-oxohepta-3-ene-1,7-dioic acid hydratase in catechol pathway